LLGFVRPTFSQSPLETVGRAPLIGVIPGFHASLSALLFAIPVSILSENAARNYPVAAYRHGQKWTIFCYAIA
jgi:hypothetical protein